MRSWIASLNVNYGNNGGSSSAVSSYANKDGNISTLTENVSVTITSQKASRTGYNFASWGGYAPGSTYTASVSRSSYDAATGSKSVTLNAKWSEKTYAVSFNANGGSGAPSSQTKKYFSDLTLSASIPTKEGYVFKSWNTSKDGTGTSYAAGAAYKTNAAVTLYAQYVPAKYAITYNANEGTGAPATQTKTHGESATLSSTVPSRTGYAFTRWTTNADGTGTVYNPGSVYSNDADVTLYAQWVEGYTVSFDANGGTGDIATQTKYKDQSLTLTSSKPSRTGYTFQSWNTDPNGAGVSYQPGGTYAGNTALNLFAIWKANSYSVSFSPAAAGKTVVYDQKLGDLPEVSNTGYTFRAWTLEGSDVTKDTIMKTAGNITLVASFVANSYKVTLDAAGGSVAEASIPVTYDSAIGTIPEPERTGYTFTGWVQGSVPVTPSTIYRTADDSELTATWLPNHYTVTYEPGDGSGTPFIQSIAYDEPWVTNSVNAFHKVGYKQVSWGQYELGQEVNSWSDMTLQAVYKIATFTITLGDEQRQVEYGDLLGALPTPGLPGKSFKGWKVNGRDIKYDDRYLWDGDVTAEPVYGDLTFREATVYVKDHDGLHVGDAGGSVYVVEG